MIKRLGILALVFGLVWVAATFGRGVWYPYWVKLGGGRTIAQVVGDLKAKGVARDLKAPAEIDAMLLVAVKDTRRLELWTRRTGGVYTKVREYAFTAFSGRTGPKLREGDGQIPEGVYPLEYLNPNSSYHLSIKVGYPNAFDREMGKRDGRTSLGGDIFIHGKDVTIGCIPIGDTAIEELFVWVAEVGLAKCRVIIMPVDFRIGATEPEIAGIEWKNALYAEIRAALRKEFGEGGEAAN